MKTFITKIFLYCIPIILLYVFPIALFFVSKEYLPLDKVVEIQRENPETLIGFSYYGEANLRYKMLLLENAKPDVIVFGSSRTFQIRKEFFKNPNSFLNVAVPRPSIGNLVNAKSFIEELPKDGKQRLLILLLDKRFFTESYEKSSDRESDSFTYKFFHLSGKPLRLMYLDYMAKKYSFRDLMYASAHTNNVGLWALVRDSGYRADGSYKQGYETKVPERKDNLKGEIKGRVKEIQNYTPSLLSKEEKLIPDNIQGLTDILSLCKERNIIVVGFIPPDPIEVTREINKNESLYAKSQNKLVDEIASTFSKHNSIFFDLSDISLFGGKNDEFIDLIHGGDLVYARALLYMGINDMTMKKYVDIPKLQNIVRNSKGDFLDF